MKNSRVRVLDKEIRNIEIEFKYLKSVGKFENFPNIEKFVSTLIMFQSLGTITVESLGIRLYIPFTGRIEKIMDTIIDESQEIEQKGNEEV